MRRSHVRPWLPQPGDSFVQANRQEAHVIWQTTVNSFEKNWPRLARFMENSESDVLAYMDFPQNHWSKIYSTNPLERINKEVKRRSAVVGIFPVVPP